MKRAASTARDAAVVESERQGHPQVRFYFAAIHHDGIVAQAAGAQDSHGRGTTTGVA